MIEKRKNIKKSYTSAFSEVINVILSEKRTISDLIVSLSEIDTGRLLNIGKKLIKTMLQQIFIL